MSVIPSHADKSTMKNTRAVHRCEQNIFLFKILTLLPHFKSFFVQRLPASLMKDSRCSCVSDSVIDYTGLHSFLTLFNAQEEKLVTLIAFFSAEYEHCSHFFRARPVLPKF